MNWDYDINRRPIAVLEQAKTEFIVLPVLRSKDSQIRNTKSCKHLDR